MPTQTKPNILFILSDQQRWDTLGCYGQKMNVTPNLDLMAGRGVRFEYVFTVQPLCGPVRAALQIGKYPTEIGCFRNHLSLPENEKTIADRLSETGYETAYIGKWHLASSKEEDYTVKPVPINRRAGYKDYWLAADALESTSHPYEGHLFDAEMNKVKFKGYRVDCLTDYAIKYLQNRNSSRPFFLYLSYLEPHHQNDWGRFAGPAGSAEKYKEFEVPGDLAGADGDWRENFPDYLGCCASLDNNVGRLLETLKKLGILENTIVFYASDHGCHFRTRIPERQPEYKRSCHESSIRVPLIACGPGFEGGNVVSNLVSLIDIPPTLLACAGLPKPPEMRGRPLQELLAGTDSWPERVFVQISESYIGRAVRTKKWKYSITCPHKNPTQEPAGDIYFEDFLYDLENDPYEKINLICHPDHADVRANLAEILTQHMKEINDPIKSIVEKCVTF